MAMNVQLSNKPCFFYNPTSGAIWQAFGEWQKPPAGWTRIVCNTAREAEQWSERMRHWDSLMHEISQEERELVEGPMRDEMRSELRHNLANSRNNINREFLRRALERLDKQGNRMRYQRESRMAIEAYEESTLRRR